MLAVVALPALLVFAAWRGYVVVNLRGHELPFLAAGDWGFAAIPEILGAMLGVASHKGGYFLMMAMILIAAVWGARRRTPDATARLLGLAALVFLGYIAALALVYVTAFQGVSRLGCPVVLALPDPARAARRPHRRGGARLLGRAVVRAIPSPDLGGRGGDRPHRRPALRLRRSLPP